jgi:hypothetical protein
VALLTAAKGGLTLAAKPAAARARLAARTATTPGRLTLYLTVIGILAALAGLAAVVGTAQRSSLVDSVATGSGPLTVQAQQLYRSLSDADATAAAAFLSSGAEPAALRERYQTDIAAASAALAAASATRDSSGRTAGGTAVAQLAASLPVYTGLVETARTYNRLNLPVGAAYLREASGLMRERLLPAAQELYRVETGQLAADRDGASAFPWLATGLILLTLAGLVVAQVYLVRRTRRLINVGLAAATAAGVVAVAWLGASWLGSATNLSAGDRDGSAQVAIVAEARIAALQARADEALTLVARGSGGAFEEGFKANVAQLVGTEATPGLLARAQAAATDQAVRDQLAAASDALTRWRAVHDKLRGLDDGGQYPDAVALAVGGEPTSAASVFNQVDAALASAISTSNATFAERASRAGGALTASGVGLALLTVLLVAGLIVGLQRRIAEYR